MRKLDVFTGFDEDPDSHQAGRNLFTQLLQSCTGSLEELYDQGFCVQTLQLSPVPLRNLSFLALIINHPPGLENLWNSLASIDGDKMMPTLKTMMVRVNVRCQRWPPDYPGACDVRYSYNSVRQLQIDFASCKMVNMLEIKTVFPHVTSLRFWLNQSECIPLRELWELWPNLEKLNIHGNDLTLTHNYDADFCGITEERAKELREMDEDRLRTVQVETICPSLLTMRSKS